MRVAGERTLELVLEELEGDDWEEQDRALMEAPVNPAARFRVDDLDYLKDTDGDGVADANERLRRTDAEDAGSTPGRSTIDVVVLYSAGYAEQHRNPTTRISHLFTVANEIVDGSGIDLRFRVVGTVPVEIEDEENSSSRVDVATVRLEAERHAADVTVVFRSSPADVGSCGWSPVGAYRGRGHFGAEELQALSGWYATVVGRCSGRTLAHELGHLMGLHHSVWQDDFGTWRWSRGYGVEGDFHTTMSYGSGGVSIPVFSNPELNCAGLLREEKPCGAELDDVDASDATTSLNAVRFLIAGHRRGLPDADRDGFVDVVDAMPDDADEWWDTDGDGTGDNADLDDDNDGSNDVVDAFPRDPTETLDTDDDGVGNNADPFPNDASETADTDGDGVGDNADAFPRRPQRIGGQRWGRRRRQLRCLPEDTTEYADTDATKPATGRTWTPMRWRGGRAGPVPGRCNAVGARVLAVRRRAGRRLAGHRPRRRRHRVRAGRSGLRCRHRRGMLARCISSPSRTSQLSMLSMAPRSGASTCRTSHQAKRRGASWVPGRAPRLAPALRALATWTAMARPTS